MASLAIKTLTIVNFAIITLTIINLTMKNINFVGKWMLRTIDIAKKCNGFIKM